MPVNMGHVPRYGISTYRYLSIVALGTDRFKTIRQRVPSPSRTRSLGLRCATPSACRGWMDSRSVWAKQAMI